MYIAKINITTELGNTKESKEFSSSTEAMKFANDFVLPHLQHCKTISGEWVVYDKDTWLQVMRSNPLITDHQQRVDRIRR